MTRAEALDMFKTLAEANLEHSYPGEVSDVRIDRVEMGEPAKIFGHYYRGKMQVKVTFDFKLALTDEVVKALKEEPCPSAGT